MEATTQKIDLNNIDKSKWKTFQFEEIAAKISETVDPNSTTLDTYVGLEHLDAEDIHIRRKGTPDDVSGGKLKCYPGDVIFGKRRAYQRKAAIVDFEGICSAHAFVFRANQEVIDPKLFPFFLHSDQFMHRMVDISVGGLSPTINWGDLKHQEFLLPPKDQQAQLAELLWVMDEVIEREREVLEKLIVSQKVKNKTVFNAIRATMEFRKLGDLCEIERGGSPRPIDDYITDEEDGLNWIKIGDVDIESKYITQSKQKIKPSGLNKTRSVHRGDLLLSNSMSFGRPYILKIDGCIHDGWLVIHDKNKVFDKEYLYYYLSSDTVFSQFQKLAAGGVVSNLNKEIVKKLKVYLPPIKVQTQIKEKLCIMEENKSLLQSKISSSQSLQKTLINHIF
jgi:restriction endonuclease S subunit